MYKKYYSRFLTTNPHIQHYASHSHHYWPDITREATIEYWDDSAKYIDDKWNHIFGKKIPEAQTLIAEVLNLSRPEQIVFAPNTHEFVYRLFSCFGKKTISVLTTDSEFYSFDRQINRLAEEKLVLVEKISTQPFDNFEERFIEKINGNQYDMIFFSHVFFNSGMLIKNLKRIVDCVQESNTMIVIDGYHGFMAVPTDLREIEDRIFYISGSYKYAQGGEGACFMHVPVSAKKYRPLYTGWFAGFGSLAKDGGNTGYSNDGYRFAGSTMDFAALYRLIAVLSLFKKEGLSVEKIHSHVQKLQKNFRTHLLDIDHHYLTEKNILSVDYNHHGHFLTFAMPSPEHTKTLHDELRAHNIWTDYRGSRLRFGFGIYQEECIDLAALIKKS